jgi:sortase (surface protein transpeptidase)
VLVVPITLEASTLVPPADPQVLGWWSQGAQPGAPRGTALITGHTVHTGGGALDHLDEARRGDRITVQGRHGTIVMRVKRVEILEKDLLAARAPRLFSQTVPGRLALVTCENWNGTTYDANVVVIARTT